MKMRGPNSKGSVESNSPRTHVKTKPSSKLAFNFHRSPAFHFCLRFCLLLGVFYGLILTPFCDRLFYNYLGATAHLGSGILNWFGQQSHVAELTIRSARFAIRVQRGCDAIEPSWFFCAAVISFPAPAWRKMIGMAGVVVLLQLLNLLRVVSLYLIGLNYPGFFRAAHVEIWPAVFIIAAALLWIGWIRWAAAIVRPGLYART